MKEETSRDVRHQCELAIYQIENENGEALDFILEDTDGTECQLSEFTNNKWVVLLWVFADWCPVCHGEFHDLMEIHEIYRGRVMVGKEIDPEYWFAKESFKEAYTNNIW